MRYVTRRIDWEGVLVRCKGRPQGMAKPSFSGQRRDDCEGKIFQRLKVAGEVTITPKVECGPVQELLGEVPMEVRLETGCSLVGVPDCSGESGSHR